MADTRTYRDKIGFLGVPQSISFDGGELLLLPDYAENKDYVDTRTHQDGFVYPPEVAAYETHVERSSEGRLLIRRGQTPIPNTRQPATLYRLPASHELRVCGIVGDAPRFGDAGFVLHALAFAYGVRLQFFDWWFDGRVSIHPGEDWDATHDAVSDFVSSAYRVWRGYGPDSQKRITNLLYTTTRVVSYNFDWEQFTFSYMVLDGCFCLAEKHHGVNVKRRHKERIQAMCECFNIPVQTDSLETIVKLRNALFHENLWANRTLGSPAGQVFYIQLLSLRKICRRVLAALRGFNGDFVQSKWWTRDKDSLER